MTINLEPPALQVDFAFSLKEVRERLLVDALQSCVQQIDLTILDSQLHLFSDAEALKRLAMYGLRGELLFAVPCILEHNPELLGYYRLLLGYSQKAFYTSGSGVGQFKSMEERGKISTRQRLSLTALCQALCESATFFVNGLADYMLDYRFLDDLTLLTLGPQLRGGANVQRGTAAIVQVFDIIQEIVQNSIVQSSKHQIEIKGTSINIA